MHTRHAVKDLFKADYEASLARNGFHFDKRIGRFFDLWAAGVPKALIPPVRTSRGHILRRETIAALLKARADQDAKLAAAEALRAEQERVAASIAPRCLPPPRGALNGAEAVAALADDFITITTRDDGAAVNDLMRLGWRKTQIFQHADAARALAYSRQGGNAA